jgi:hypothetical protein
MIPLSCPSQELTVCSLVLGLLPLSRLLEMLLASLCSSVFNSLGVQMLLDLVSQHGSQRGPKVSGFRLSLTIREEFLMFRTFRFIILFMLPINGMLPPRMI